MIQFSVEIKPVAWGRVNRSRTGHAYVPEKTRRFKIDFARAASRYKPAAPFTTALELWVNFTLIPPKTRKKPHPIVRPDLDNYCKAVLDALNGIFWVDDSQIVTLMSRKRYGDEPRIAVEIREVA